MIKFEYKEKYNVEDLREITRILRHPGGCPWDIEQTHESIRRNFIEEAYEVAEAIDELGIEGDYEGIGNCILGYRDEGGVKEVSPRKANYIVKV